MDKETKKEYLRYAMRILGGIVAGFLYVLITAAILWFGDAMGWPL